jgi:hypothetical protein
MCNKASESNFEPSVDNKIYLVERLSELSGFFNHNGNKLFIVFNANHDKPNSIRTNLLEMDTHVYINSIENDNTFKSGYCNVIKYTGEQQSIECESFMDLCKLYSKNPNESSFFDFFYALLELFQLPQEQSYKNALGLYGELKFLESVKTEYSVDLSSVWHVSGPFSRMDFSFADYGIEVKTTIMENCVAIKHEQLFNEHDNYLATVVCENYDSGECLKDLESKMIKMFPSFSFAVKLKKELQRIKPYEIENAKFLLKEIHVYETKKINPFIQVPDSVNFLKYELDLSDASELSESDIKRLLFHG